jgi:prolipoprotein diacylglyceryl transferase
VPKFEWKIDPVFFEIPINIVIAGLVVGALISLLGAWRKRASDLAWFGMALLAVAFAVSRFAKGPLEIRYYSLIFVGVFLGGYSLLNWQIRRGGGDEEDAGDFIVYGVIAVLLGARLGHVIFYDREKALEDPLWILQIWTGGLASHGAVIGLIIAMWLFTKRRGVPFLEGADRFAWSAALGATLVRLGNFFNSEIVGRRTDQTWGVQFPRFDQRLAEVPYRHPSQLYEFVLGLAVLAILFAVDRALGKEKRPRGAIIATFFITYFSGRFGIEFFKEYEAISPDSPLTMGQYLSLPGILFGFYGLYWSLKHKLPVGWTSPERARDLDGGDEDEDPHLYDPDVEDEFGGRRARIAADAKRRRKQSMEGDQPTAGKSKKKRKQPVAEASSSAEAPPAGAGDQPLADGTADASLPAAGERDPDENRST